MQKKCHSKHRPAECSSIRARHGAIGLEGRVGGGGGGGGDESEGGGKKKVWVGRELGVVPGRTFDFHPFSRVSRPATVSKRLLLQTTQKRASWCKVEGERRNEEEESPDINTHMHTNKNCSTRLPFGSHFGSHVTTTLITIWQIKQNGAWCCVLELFVGLCFGHRSIRCDCEPRYALRKKSQSQAYVFVCVCICVFVLNWFFCSVKRCHDFDFFGFFSLSTINQSFGIFFFFVVFKNYSFPAECMYRSYVPIHVHRR